MAKHDRRKTSGQPPSSRPVTIQVPLPVLGVVNGVREAFHGLCIATGLHVLEAMMEADRQVLCGPKGRHQVERPAWRGGSVDSQVTLGGRQIEDPYREPAVGHHDAATREVEFNDRFQAFAAYWGPGSRCPEATRSCRRGSGTSSPKRAHSCGGCGRRPAAIRAARGAANGTTRTRSWTAGSASPAFARSPRARTAGPCSRPSWRRWPASTCSASCRPAPANRCATRCRLCRATTRRGR